MNWTIKIGDKSKERILVEYDPIAGFLYAHGQYKIHTLWKDLSFDKIEANDVDFEKIKKLLADTLIALEKRIVIYEDLDKTFEAIGGIGIESDEEGETNSPYINIT